MSVYVESNRLEAGLAHVLASPSDLGTVELVVRRPAEGEREILDEGVVDFPGLVGDRHTLRQDTHAGTEITLMNARVVDLVAGGDRERWALAGDQLYVDFDLRHENLPPGSRLQVGSATLEVSEMPHTGCAKFTARFGSAATQFINGKPHRDLRLRGMNTRVITPGTVRPGDTIQKL
ncbi:MAG TPA: MOSC domain-containing protein [Gaiellaceae bacterium]|nr:MOSC domain-containing protein [Gaiellaceae bacterium]